MNEVISFSFADLTVILTFVAVLVGGAIQIGSMRNQIQINTTRLNHLEGIIDGVHDMPMLEKRVDRIERKVFNGTP